MNNNNDDASTAMRGVPDYESDYWLNNKENNLILKRIIDFLTSSGGGTKRVTPLLDDQKHVHLMVQEDNCQKEEIIFGGKFPQEAPILILENIMVGESNATTWHYYGDIYESFIRYYDNNHHLYNFVESVRIRFCDIDAIRNSSQSVHEGCVDTDMGLEYDDSIGTWIIKKRQI